MVLDARQSMDGSRPTAIVQFIRYKSIYFIHFIEQLIKMESHGLFSLDCIDNVEIR